MLFLNSINELSNRIMAKIIYVMGPSGSGKDTIIDAVREQHLDNLQVAHRYITRHWQSGGENHIGLSQAEYEQRQALGLFAMAWSANRHQYAIGREIDLWLKCQQNVLVNGSRTYLPTAMALYPRMIEPVLVDVAADKLEERLVKRGRESLSEIASRIQRHSQLRASFADDQAGQYTVIENNHSIADSTAQLLAIIKRCS
ncbi:MAG: ribose 1,5-bisphosphokinase [Oceanospirillaceae bacterium]|jgi:ribose 1,5-bisphosphokinase